MRVEGEEIKNDLSILSLLVWYECQYYDLKKVKVNVHGVSITGGGRGYHHKELFFNGVG